MYMYSVNTVILYVYMTIYKLLMKLGIQEVKTKLYIYIPVEITVVNYSYSSQIHFLQLSFLQC